MNFVIVTKRIKFCFSHQGQKKYFFKVKDGQKIQPQTIVLPAQYPKNLKDNTPLIRRGRSIQYITPRYQIPDDSTSEQSDLVLINKYKGKWKSPPNAYNLNIGLIGPVNSGKSQLMGKLIGSHISAVSPKANTTDETIQAYKTFEVESDQGIKNVQLKYFDTAGMMYRKTGFISKGWKVLSEIDFSLLVVDSAKRFDQMTKQAIKRLQRHRNYQNFMKALVLNKIDLVDNKRKFHSLISQIQKHGKFDKIFYVSVQTGYGIEQLQNYLIKMSKKRDWEQPKQVSTTLTQVQIYEQLLKQCIYHRSYKQVPYNLSIQTVSVAKKSDGTEQIMFKISVQNQNQQRMITGKQGNNVLWMIQRFKTLYAQNYKKQVDVKIQIVIKKAFHKKYSMPQETLFDEASQKQFFRQKIQAAQQLLLFKKKILKIKSKS